MPPRLDRATVTEHGIVVSPVVHEAHLHYWAICTCGWERYRDTHSAAHHEGNEHLDGYREQHNDRLFYGLTP